MKVIDQKEWGVYVQNNTSWKGEDDEPSVIVQSYGEIEPDAFATAAISVLYLEHGMTKEALLEVYEAVAHGSADRPTH